MNHQFLCLDLLCFTVIKPCPISIGSTAKLIKQTGEASTLTTFKETTNDLSVVIIIVPKLDSTDTATQSVYIQNRAISNVTASGRNANGRVAVDYLMGKLQALLSVLLCFSASAVSVVLVLKRADIGKL